MIKYYNKDNICFSEGVVNKRVKFVAVIVAVVMLVACLSIGLTACNLDGIESRNLNMIADQFASIMMGDNPFNWNAFAIDPENSYGHTRTLSGEWYSYTAPTAEDMSGVYQAFKLFSDYLSRINTKNLNKKDIATYNSMRSTLDSYLAYYGSEYVLDFELMSGDYITAEGGYVADFATSVENFEFRDRTDLDTLLPVVRSTRDAFKSYLDFAADRVLANQPLYDYTLTEMQNYLSEILEQGDSYYLYSFLDRKIDALSFLTDSEKTSYKNSFRQAIKNDFFPGVRTLHDGLSQYMGHVTEINRSYLANFDEAGKAYYKWSFENKTGLKNVNITEEYFKLLDAHGKYYDEMDGITEYVESVKDTKPEVYAEFNAYLSGEKKLLDLTDPTEMLAYLKTASRSIVPDLATEPSISFKYMDETVGKRTSTLAYYLISPFDAVNTEEHITINPYNTDSADDPLLLIIAHEGYPGHLYAHVNAKESGSSTMTLMNRSLAFVEGWAVYTELALLDVIASATDSEALKLYCEYYKNTIMVGYLSPLISDMNINYFGFSVDDLEGEGNDRERVIKTMQILMEMPTLYVSYGYGVYALASLHDTARSELGDKYNEVEFNGLLLSEGMGPTLIRAGELTESYINSKR